MLGFCIFRIPYQFLVFSKRFPFQTAYIAYTQLCNCVLFFLIQYVRQPMDVFWLRALIAKLLVQLKFFGKKSNRKHMCTVQFHNKFFRPTAERNYDYFLSLSFCFHFVLCLTFFSLYFFLLHLQSVIIAPLHISLYKRINENENQTHFYDAESMLLTLLFSVIK